ncbi:hypothetical protein LA345_38995 (plasmid) [Burkholderia vietnamiensis]|uniref:Uncharacterized protein n=1 Tax=Burkholderia vietnamiensis (strain G4 / LMG 22486) TaxID=269482 RepID=A4JWF9_BURVG|nr:hypothetical protein Bcep1808_7742 [Burkholderia vietnamiensis G4]MCB4349787.1 hypothetical protein [Burkholderia vietnamiensis]
MTLQELAASCSWAFGLVIDEAEQTKQAINATRFYLGWGAVASMEPVEPDDPPPQVLYDPLLGWYGGIYGGQYISVVDGTHPPYTPPATDTDPPPVPEGLSADTDITNSEWALIKPLYMLYIERENARALEASRGLGVDVYGRDVSQIEQDIRQYETQDLPRLAFEQDAQTI